MTPTFPHKIATHSKHSLTGSARFLVAATSVLLLSVEAAPLATAQTSTLVVMNATGAKSPAGDTSKILPPLVQTDIASIKVGGKAATVKSFEPLLTGSHGIQLVIALDNGQQIGILDQFDSIKKFMNSMPPNVEIAVGYMVQAHVRIVQGFTKDRALDGAALRLPTRLEVSDTRNDTGGNPFGCLTDLATKWPDPDPTKIRAVLFFTDGLMRGNSVSQGGDADNPNVTAAEVSLQRAGILPFPFYFMDPHPPTRGGGGLLEGPQNFSQLVRSTSGGALYDGQYAPSSLDPLLDRLYRVLDSDVVVTLVSPGKPGDFKQLDIKSAKPEIKVTGPDNITLGNVLKTKYVPGAK